MWWHPQPPTDHEVDEANEDEEAARIDAAHLAFIGSAAPPPSAEQVAVHDLAAFVAAEVEDEMIELRKKMRVSNDNAGTTIFVADTSAAAAPWCYLLAPHSASTTPFTWSLSAMLNLRAVCKGLHGGLSTATFFDLLLDELGWSSRGWSCAAPPGPITADVALRHSFRACHALLTEVEFVRCLGQLGRFPGACCVAGSHALHRLMLLDLGMNPDFAPRDMDVFVADPECVLAVRKLSEAFLAHLYGAGTHFKNDLNHAYPGGVNLGFDQWHAWPFAGHSHSYDRDLLVRALSTHFARFPPHHIEAARQLPSTVGLPRPYSIQPVGCVETLYAGQPWAFTGGLHCPHTIQIINARFPERTPAARVIDAFDMYQCKVVLQAPEAGVGVPSGLTFLCDETARQCAEAKQIRLTRYATLPLRDLPEDDVEVSVLLWKKCETLVRRIGKYEGHGFKLVPAPVAPDE